MNMHDRWEVCGGSTCAGMRSDLVTHAMTLRNQNAMEVHCKDGRTVP